MKKKIIIIGSIVLLVAVLAGVYLRFIMDWGNAENTVVENEVKLGEVVETVSGVKINEIPTDISGSFISEPTSVETPTTQLMFTVTGPQDATGKFTDFKVEYNKEKESLGNIKVTIQANSITTNNSTRDEHLLKPDFFNVETYSNITFQSSEIKLGDTSYIAVGSINFLGIEAPIEIPFIFRGENTRDNGKQFLGFKGSLKFDRTKFGMTHSDDIGDVVDVVFSTEVVAQ